MFFTKTKSFLGLEMFEQISKYWHGISLENADEKEAFTYR